MPVDLRVTPAADAVPKVPGLKDNPSLSQLSLGQFGMEVAGEIGVDPNNLASYGLSADKINQLEQATHSGNRSNRR